MIYLICSIFANVSASLVMILIKKRQIEIPAIVFINYLFGIAYICIFFHPTDIHLSNYASHWWVFAALGILMPTVFIALGKSVQNAGLAKTDAAQRLSLFISILAAFFLFQESYNHYKLLAIIMAFAALALLMKFDRQEKHANHWYLLAVFFGYGLCDILYKRIAQTNLVYVNYLLISFILAASIMLLYILYRKITIKLPTLFFGFLLGSFNFINIFTYVKAHQILANQTIMVYVTMNVGVIILGLLVSVIYLKEAISKINLLGIFLAILSIVILMLNR